MKKGSGQKPSPRKPDSTPDALRRIREQRGRERRRLEEARGATRTYRQLDEAAVDEDTVDEDTVPTRLKKTKPQDSAVVLQGDAGPSEECAVPEDVSLGFDESGDEQESPHDRDIIPTDGRPFPDGVLSTGEIYVEEGPPEKKETSDHPVSPPQPPVRRPLFGVSVPSGQPLAKTVTDEGATSEERMRKFREVSETGHRNPVDRFPRYSGAGALSPRSLSKSGGRAPFSDRKSGHLPRRIAPAPGGPSVAALALSPRQTGLSMPFPFSKGAVQLPPLDPSLVSGESSVVADKNMEEEKEPRRSISMSDVGVSETPPSQALQGQLEKLRREYGRGDGGFTEVDGGPAFVPTSHRGVTGVPSAPGGGGLRRVVPTTGVEEEEHFDSLVPGGVGGRGEENREDRKTKKKDSGSTAGCCTALFGFCRKPDRSRDYRSGDGEEGKRLVDESHPAIGYGTEALFSVVSSEDASQPPHPQTMGSPEPGSSRHSKTTEKKDRSGCLRKSKACALAVFGCFGAVVKQGGKGVATILRSPVTAYTVTIVPLMAYYILQRYHTEYDPKRRPDGWKKEIDFIGDEQLEKAVEEALEGGFPYIVRNLVWDFMKYFFPIAVGADAFLAVAKILLDLAYKISEAREWLKELGIPEEKISLGNGLLWQAALSKRVKNRVTGEYGVVPDIPGIDNLVLTVGLGIYYGQNRRFSGLYEENLPGARAKVDALYPYDNEVLNHEIRAVRDAGSRTDLKVNTDNYIYGIAAMIFVIGGFKLFKHFFLEKKDFFGELRELQRRQNMMQEDPRVAITGDMVSLRSELRELASMTPSEIAGIIKKAQEGNAEAKQALKEGVHVGYEQVLRYRNVRRGEEDGEIDLEHGGRGLAL